MVNHPNSTPPPGQGPKPDETAGQVGGSNETNAKKPSGKVHFKNPGKFLGMTFTQKEWDQLMNIFLKNIGTSITRSSQETIKQMKENWRREQEG